LLDRHQTEASLAAGVPAGVLDAALQAVRSADRAALAELLRLHPRLIAVQVTPAPGSNLLHEACRVNPEAIGRPAGDVVAVIDLLLAAGIDIKAPFRLPEGGQLTATFAAVRSGSLEVLRHVLDRGGGPGGMYSALGRPEAIRLLHQHGADLEEMAYDETPLLHALKNRNLVATRTLLELGADVNHADSKGATPLHYAVRQYHQPEVIALLLAHGASREARSHKGATPLDLAVRIGRHDVAALLGGATFAWHAPVGPDGVRLLPFFNHEQGSIGDVVAFYQRLGFRCVSHDYDHGFAKLSLGEITLLNDEGADSREDATGEGVAIRCPEPVFSAVRSALESGGISHTSAGSDLRVHDVSGFELLFRAGPGVASVEAMAAVADLSRAAAFYQQVGFRPVEDGGLGEGLALQLGSARVHLRERPGLGARRALHLWLPCDDLDGRYRQLSARMPIDPPQVAFHGDITLGLSDPDGHRLTFAAPANDI
jgi:hypothetical protein